MIRLVEQLPILQGDALPLLRVRALWECYGTVPFIRYYVGDEGSAAAILDGQAVVYAVPSEREEFAWFLAMQPDISSVLTDAMMASAVAEQWGTAASTIPVMRCDTPQTASVTDVASPREMYAFLQPIFPSLSPFDSWYPDVCYRERHGFCRNVAVRDNGEIVSAAMTVAEWDGGALIGGVATAPTHRRRGLAARCVGTLAARLQGEGKAVYICPKNEGAQRVYTALGFAVCGSIAVTERNFDE